jgi:Zn-dependent peptidase ImmA (M78 family)
MVRRILEEERVKADVNRAETIARQILKQGGYKPPIDITEIVLEHGLTLQEEQLEDNVSGMLMIHGAHAMIGINEGHHPHRKRFTIAHELGHYMLHRDASDVFVDAFLRSERSSKGDDPQEIEANAFAAELLMPKRQLINAVADCPYNALDEGAIRHLAARFGVSTTAMAIRLTRCNFILG